MNTVINVYGKDIEFDSELLNLYKKTTTNALEEMIPMIFAAKFNNACNCDEQKRLALIQETSVSELKDTILDWIRFDLKCYNVVI